MEKSVFFAFVYSEFRYLFHTNEVKQNDTLYRFRFGGIALSIRFDTDRLLACLLLTDIFFASSGLLLF